MPKLKDLPNPIPSLSEDTTEDRLAADSFDREPPSGDDDCDEGMFID